MLGWGALREEDPAARSACSEVWVRGVCFTQGTALEKEE